MAYSTYTTEAIVCGIQQVREHDLSLRLFTRDAGMLFARAGGVRANQSKLRYGLQEFSHVRVTLVRGKADWRVTGAVAIRNFYFDARERSSRASLLAAMRTVRRLLRGEDPYPELFAVVLDGLSTLAENGQPHAEVLFQLRLLHHLGYLPLRPLYTELLHAPTLEAAYAGGHTIAISALRPFVEDALLASHL